MIYLDSAILVKLYTREPDSQHWRDVLEGQTDLATSALALPEMKSALRRKVGAGLLKPAVASESWIEFRADIDGGAIRTFPIGTDVLDESVEVLETLPPRILLRTLDALHLATAKLIGASALATTDQRMREGARAMAIALL